MVGCANCEEQGYNPEMKNGQDPSRDNPDVERFEKWAATYDQSIMQKLFFGPIQAGMLGLIAKESFTKPPGCIIDVGCGTGRLLKAASARWPEAKVYGVDPAENMVARAAQLNPRAIFQRGTAEALPFPDSTADLVVSSLSFHHWADQARGIREIARVLRPGGWFCLADHTFIPARLFGDRVKSRSQARALMIEAGLYVRKQRWFWIPYILITLAQK